jgi:hypothetical protein
MMGRKVESEIESGSGCGEKVACEERWDYTVSALYTPTHANGTPMSPSEL